MEMEAERAVQEACRRAVREGLFEVAHDCSDGGLAVALAEMCIAGGTGADVDLGGLEHTGYYGPGPQRLRSDALLFGEDASRIVVAMPADRFPWLFEIAHATGAYLAHLGTTGGDTLRITRHSENDEDGRGQAVIEVSVGDMERSWRGGLG